MMADHFNENHECIDIPWTWNVHVYQPAKTALEIVWNALQNLKTLRLYEKINSSKTVIIGCWTFPVIVRY